LHLLHCDRRFAHQQALYLIEAFGAIHSFYPPVVTLGALVELIIVNFLTNILRFATIRR